MEEVVAKGVLVILFTLDIKKSVLAYLKVTIFLVVLNYIYSLFSHNVSSDYMTYMFVYPLIGGLIVNLILVRNKKVNRVKLYYIGKIVLNYGIATLIVGSFIKGVFEIAGTDSTYIVYYFYLGTILISMGILFLLYSLYRANNINR